MCTAAVGLYGKKSSEGTSGAELYPPWEEGGKNKYAGEPIVIFGAGSNVGCHSKCYCFRYMSQDRTTPPAQQPAGSLAGDQSDSVSQP